MVLALEKDSSHFSSRVYDLSSHGQLTRLIVLNVNSLPVCRPSIQLDFTDLHSQSEDIEF